MCNSDDSSDDSDLEDKMAKLTVTKNKSSIPMDLQVAAKAANMDSSSSDSELDSDDDTSSEESE